MYRSKPPKNSPSDEVPIDPSYDTQSPTADEAENRETAHTLDVCMLDNIRDENEPDDSFPVYRAYLKI